MGTRREITLFQRLVALVIATSFLCSGITPSAYSSGPDKLSPCSLFKFFEKKGLGLAETLNTEARILAIRNEVLARNNILPAGELERISRDSVKTDLSDRFKIHYGSIRKTDGYPDVYRMTANLYRDGYGNTQTIIFYPKDKIPIDLLKNKFGVRTPDDEESAKRGFWIVSGEVSIPKKIIVPAEERKYLAPQEQQEAVFDQIPNRDILDPELEYIQTYKTAQQVFCNVLKSAGLNPEIYQLYLIKDETPNAFMIPYATRVYMNIGCLQIITKMPLDAQKSILAFVFSHEVTHILQYREDVDRGATPSLLGFSVYNYLKEHVKQYTNEYNADARALSIMDKSGYSVRYATMFFEKIIEEYKIESHSSRPWSSHPGTQQRIFELKRIIKKHYWRSWDKKEPFPEEVRSELAKPSEYDKFIERVDNFSGKELKIRFRHMDDLLKMIDDAPDYNALLFIMRHIYFYSSHFFDRFSEAIEREDSYKEVVARNKDTNFTDISRKKFVEEGLMRFLKMADKLRIRNIPYYLILEKVIVDSFAQNTVFLYKGTVTKQQIDEAGLKWDDVFKKLTNPRNNLAESISQTTVRLTVDPDKSRFDIREVFGDDFFKIFPILQESHKLYKINEESIYKKAKYIPIDIPEWFNNSSPFEKMDFISLVLPSAGARYSSKLDSNHDTFYNVLFGGLILKHKETALESLIKEIKENGDYKIVTSSLMHLRQLYHVGNNRAVWTLEQEDSLIKAYFEYIKKHGDLKERIYDITVLFNIMPLDHEMVDEITLRGSYFNYVYDALPNIFKNDPEGFEKFVDFISRDENGRIHLLYHERSKDARRQHISPTLPALFNDAERNIKMLAKLWKMDKPHSHDSFYIDDLGTLLTRMGIKGYKERINFWLCAYKNCTITQYPLLYSHLRDHVSASISEKVYKELTALAEGDCNGYLNKELSAFSAEYGIGKLSGLSTRLKILYFMHYRFGPIPLTMFFDKDGMFNIENYFIHMDEETGKSRKRESKAQFTHDDLESILLFLKKIAPYMHDKFSIPLKFNLFYSEEKAEEMSGDLSALGCKVLQDSLPISTWDEYIQMFTSYLEKIKQGALGPFICRSGEENFEGLGVFWGEIPERGLSNKAAQEWFGKREEDALFIYSRHSHKEESLNMLKLFKDIEKSPLGYDRLVKDITERYPPTVFRNYFLYSVLVYKALKALSGFDLNKAFSLDYLKEFIEGLDDKAKRDIKEKIFKLNRYLTHDWRVEVLNLGIMYYSLSKLKSEAGTKTTRRRTKRKEAALRELNAHTQPLYMTPGGAESQLDLLAALVDEKSIEEKLRLPNLDFKEKVRILLVHMPARRNNEMDRLLELLLEKTNISAGDINTILDVKELKKLFEKDQSISAILSNNFNIDEKDDNQSFFYSPLLRDKWALMALEKEHTERPELFNSWENELNRILYYFPSFSYFRDAILKAFIERRIESPEQLGRIAPFLLENQTNYYKGEVRRRIFGRDTAFWLINSTSLDTRRMFLEWVLGWRMRKPPDLIDFEYKHQINFEPFRNQVLKIKDGNIYKGVREYMLRNVLETVIDTFLDNDEITEEFTDQMMHTIVPRGVNEATFRIYQGIMDAIFSSTHRNRKKEILISLAMEWIDIQQSGKTLSNQEIEARMLGTFFQANGFMGVKLAQILSATTAFEISDIIREKLAHLKYEAKPIDKATAINVLDEALPGGFKKYFKRLIGVTIGSASLKVVYLAEDLSGNIVLVKIKRPEVVVELEDDVEFLSSLIKSIQPYLKTANINTPDNLVETVKDELIKELDFEKEKHDQDELGGILSKRKKQTKHTIKTPKSGKVYSNFIFIEEFAKGTLLEKEEQLKQKGQDIKAIRKALKYELLTELFIDGAFHLDPHAGNIIVQDNGDIVLIDNSIGHIAPPLKMPLFILLMYLYPSNVPRFAARKLGWDLKRILKDLSLNFSIDDGSLDKIIGEFEKEIIGSNEKNIAKRFIDAINFLEIKGVKLHADFGAVKKFFSAADYLLSDIGMADLYFILKLIGKLRAEHMAGINAYMIGENREGFDKKQFTKDVKKTIRTAFKEGAVKQYVWRDNQLVAIADAGTIGNEEIRIVFVDGLNLLKFNSMELFQIARASTNRNQIYLPGNLLPLLNLSEKPEDVLDYIITYEKIRKENDNALIDAPVFVVREEAVRRCGNLKYDAFLDILQISAAIEGISQKIFANKDKDLLLHLDEEGRLQIKATGGDVAIFDIDSERVIVEDYELKLNYWDVLKSKLAGRKDALLEMIPKGSNMTQIRELLVNSLLRKESILKDMALSKTNLDTIGRISTSIERKKKISISSKLLIDNINKTGENKFEFNLQASGIKYLLERIQSGFFVEIINESGVSEDDLKNLLSNIFGIGEFKINVIKLEDAERADYKEAIVLLHEKSEPGLQGFKDRGIKVLIGKKGVSINVLFTVGLYKLLDKDISEINALLLSLGYTEAQVRDIVSSGLLILPPVISILPLTNNIASFRRTVDIAA